MYFNFSNLNNFLLKIYLILIVFYDIPKTFILGISYAGILGTLLVFLLSAQRKFYIPARSSFIYFCFLTFYIFSIGVNINNLNEDKAIPHFINYSYVFVIFYLLFFNSILILGVSTFQKYIYIGACILAIIGSLEIFIYYINGFDAYANFLNHGNNVGIVKGGIPRMRSLFNEPSHLALYVIGIAPIIWNYNKFFNWIVLYLFIWTFSSSAFLGVLIAIIAFFLKNIITGIKPSYKLLSITLLIIVILLHRDIMTLPVFDKVFNVLGNAGKSSDSVRLIAFLDSMEYIYESPFWGLGATFYYNYSELGLFNLYLQLYIEVGITGILLFLSFIISARPRNKLYIFQICFIAILIQYIGMNHYYIPGIWMMLAYFTYLNLNNKVD